MFKNDKSMEFFQSLEYKEAPVLGNWYVFYVTSIGFFLAELVLFSYLTFVY